jgi:hypothetical protein
VWFDDGTGGGGTSATFSDAEADVMFAAANTIVLNADQVADVACDHTLSRSGSVFGISGTGSDGDIDNADEFAYVQRGDGFVKVVPLISFCDLMQPGIAGCAPIGNGANSLVLAEWAAKGAVGGAAVAHEYGHVVGLEHEEFLVWNFMQPVLNLENRNVTATQCTLMRSDTLDRNGPAPLRQADQEAGFAQVNGSRNVPYAALAELSILQLAHSLFFQRTPVEVEDSFGAADLDVLLDLLQHEEERDYHPTIATLVGLIGGANPDRAAVGLVSFIDRHPGTSVSRIALSALGHLAARGNQYALDTLLVNATPSSYYGPAAVVGLGVSGRPEARNALLALQTGALVVPAGSGAPTQGAGNSNLHRATVTEAVKANEAIATVGRRGYYGR